MSVKAVEPAPGEPVREILWAKWIVVTLLAYWATFAVVAPVMNYDSQVYNLARLFIAHAGGLFGNHGWNSERQVLFPWTFDAIHYPFLFIYRGYCLPSFACFLGLLIIVYRLVAAARSPRQAWWCCLSLLAMPTLVFQSVCTKNDLAVVFAVGCWYYTWRLWQAERRGVYPLFMALALCFAAGAKTSGLPFFGLLGVFTLWKLRLDRRAAVHFAGWMALCFLLFGSVEIYLNNLLVYHSALGRPAFLAENQNRDGLAGATANFIRYCFGNMNVGIDAANPASPVAAWLENACRGFLNFVGLSGNLGYRNGYGEVDANMRFLKAGFDSASDYGPVGALALIASLVFVLARPPADPLWKLAAAGLATLVLTSYTIAWMMWNARFLLMSFCLFALALTLWLLRLGDHWPGRLLRSTFFILMAYSAVIYPLHSFNKKPSDLWLALMHRPAYEMSEMPPMLEVVRDLHARASAIEPSDLLLHAGSDSWVLCILEMRDVHVVPAPTIDPEILAAASHGSRHLPGVRPVFILTVNDPVDPSVDPTLTKIKTYDAAHAALYEWRPATAAPAP